MVPDHVVGESENKPVEFTPFISGNIHCFADMRSEAFRFGDELAANLTFSAILSEPDDVPFQFFEPEKAELPFLGNCQFFLHIADQSGHFGFHIEIYYNFRGPDFSCRQNHR